MALQRIQQAFNVDLSTRRKCVQLFNEKISLKKDYDNLYETICIELETLQYAVAFFCNALSEASATNYSQIKHDLDEVVKMKKNHEIWMDDISSSIVDLNDMLNHLLVVLMIFYCLEGMRPICDNYKLVWEYVDE